MKVGSKLMLAPLVILCNPGIATSRDSIFKVGLADAGHIPEVWLLNAKPLHLDHLWLYLNDAFYLSIADIK